MAMLLFASTISMLDSIVRKNGHSRYIDRNSFRPASGRRARNDVTAEPKPYQPGSMRRHCAQLNTHGIARRSSIRDEGLREAGRLPMFKFAISPITVDSRKYWVNPGVSLTSAR